jgi:PHD/YefM family antitoxin component YafN of YafNO toxin-antitoxin module
MTNSLQFITDKKGKKTAVVMPISAYEKLMEDLDDLAVIADRHDEPTISHAKFKAELKRDGVISH